MKHKPTYQQPLSRKTMDAYRQDSPGERRAIEGQADDFELDALEGWQQLPAGTNAMRKLDRRFIRSYRYAWIISGIVLIVGLAAWILTPSGTAEKPSGKVVQLSVEHSDLVITPSIDSLTAFPEAEQIHITSLKTAQQELEQQAESVPITNVEEIPEIILEPLALKPTDKPASILRQRSAAEVSYHDLKVIDYSKYRTKPAIETERLVVSGTSADRENKEDQETFEPVRETVSIPYMEYLNKSMSYVSKGKWKESLQRFQQILETYPEDVNAHFYAGLCSYNLRQLEEAKKHFAACLQLEFSNFNEEAAWYLAQSLLANGEKDHARELFTTIMEQKGYYAEAARNALKRL